MENVWMLLSFVLPAGRNGGTTEQKLKDLAMQLRKDHRASLLIELEKAKKEAREYGRTLENFLNDGTGTLESFEITVYLAQQRVITIEAAIEANDIDY